MFFHQTQPAAPGGAVAPGDPSESGGPQGLSLFQHLRQGGKSAGFSLSNPMGLDVGYGSIPIDTLL